jgi:hypothetical protein
VNKTRPDSSSDACLEWQRAELRACLPPRSEGHAGACFVGFTDEDRAEKINLLASQGIPVDVYGTNWDRFFKQGSKARVHGPVFGPDMHRTLRAYRLQLNLFRPHNPGSHNMRSFEVPAVGALCLRPTVKIIGRSFATASKPSAMLTTMRW